MKKVRTNALEKTYQFDGRAKPNNIPSFITFEKWYYSLTTVAVPLGATSTIAKILGTNT